MTRRPEPSSPFPPLRLVRGDLPAPPPAIPRRLRARRAAPSLRAPREPTPKRPVYRVDCDVPEFGLLAGDRIVVDGPDEVGIVRRVRLTDAQLARLPGAGGAA